ncbi:MAG: hypothetical protein J6V25_10320 [Oscillospiraceae bacterium]|nr:hypothetical protein [Oscillospiraceae bacterium]
MMSSTAAAELLGILNISNKNDTVKSAISVLGSIYASVDRNDPLPGHKKTVSGSSLAGVLVNLGVLHRNGSSGSAYRKDGDHELRVSDHSAHAENFKGLGEHLSVVINLLHF